MSNKKDARNQQGFTVFTVILVGLIAAGVYFGYKFVVKAAKDNQKQADLISNASKGDEQESSGDPGDFEIPDAPTNAKNRPIRSVTVENQAVYVVLIADLPGDYTGTCVAEVVNQNGKGRRRFVEEFESKDECRITMPHKRLEFSGTWDYEMSYYTSDNRVRGSYKPGTFSF